MKRSYSEALAYFLIGFLLAVLLVETIVHTNLGTDNIALDAPAGTIFLAIGMFLIPSPNRLRLLLHPLTMIFFGLIICLCSFSLIMQSSNRIMYFILIGYSIGIAVNDRFRIWLEKCAGIM